MSKIENSDLCHHLKMTHSHRYFRYSIVIIVQKKNFEKSCQPTCLIKHHNVQTFGERSLYSAILDFSIRRQLQAPAALPTGKRARYPLNWRLSGPQSRYGSCGVQTNFLPRWESNSAVQSEAHRYLHLLSSRLHVTVQYRPDVELTDVLSLAYF